MSWYTGDKLLTSGKKESKTNPRFKIVSSSPHIFIRKLNDNASLNADEQVTEYPQTQGISKELEPEFRAKRWTTANWTMAKSQCLKVHLN